MIEYLRNLLHENFKYTVAHGYAGMDPQIYWRLYFSSKAGKNPSVLNRALGRLEREIFCRSDFMLGRYADFLSIDRSIILPYGLGLFLQAYSRMQDVGESGNILEEINKIKSLLGGMLLNSEDGLGVPNPSGAGNKMLGRAMTNDLTSYGPGGAEVFFGLISVYKRYADVECLATAIKIADKFANHFRLKKYPYGACFDYSDAGDETHILNASILIALVLMQADLLVGENRHDAIVGDCYAYVMKYLSSTEIPYRGVEDGDGEAVYDCYHTGFVLRSMLEISKRVRREDIYFIVDKARTMFSDFVCDGVVTSFKDKRDFDIHALAEYIGTYAEFHGYLNQTERDRLDEIVHRSIVFYSSKKNQGTYIYKNNGCYEIDVYMPRWGHSAMMNGVSKLLVAKLLGQ